MPTNHIQYVTVKVSSKLVYSKRNSKIRCFFFVVVVVVVFKFSSTFIYHLKKYNLTFHVTRQAVDSHEIPCFTYQNKKKIVNRSHVTSVNSDCYYRTSVSSE